MLTFVDMRLWPKAFEMLSDNMKNGISKFLTGALVLLPLVFSAASCGKKIDNQKDKFVAVQGVDISAKNRTLTIGQSFQLNASVRPANADNKKIIWKSSVDTVASVSSNGLVSAKKEGNTTITAVSDDKSSKFATCEITVVKQVIPITGLSIENEEIVLAIGYGDYVKVDFQPQNTTETSCVYEIEDESIATVSENGYVQGVSRGETVLTVKSENGKFSDTVPVKVVQPFTDIKLVSPSKSDANYNSKTQKFEYTEGDGFQIQVKATPEGADDVVEYSSSDAGVTVSSSGFVSVIKRPAQPYTATITATTGALKKSVSFVVYVIPKADDLDLYGISNSVGFPGDASRTKGSECIGLGVTQIWFLRPEPSAATMTSAVITGSTGSAQFSIKESATSSSGKIFQLEATLPSTSSASFGTGNTTSSVTIKAAGVTKTFFFRHTKYDPYRPKPGDGLFSASSSSTYLSFYDCGARGNFIYENSVSLSYGSSEKERIFAIIGYVGDEHLTQDSKLSSSSYSKNAAHGIAIPANADKLYVINASSNGYANNTGCMFSEDDDNLEADGEHLGWNSNKHTALTNTEYLLEYNNRRGDSHEVIPLYFVRSDEQSGSSHQEMKRWNFAQNYNYGTINAYARSAYFAYAGHSKWCIPTKADFADVFKGSEKLNDKVDIFSHSLDLLNPSSSGSYTYRGTYWLSQQYDSKNGAAVTLAPTGNWYTDGAFNVVPKTKDKGTKCYILPVLYF